MKTNTLWSAFLAGAIVSRLVSLGAMRFESVNASNDVLGIIVSDTICTRANSPYNLAGQTAIARGWTLTIEAGVTVNLNQYWLSQLEIQEIIIATRVVIIIVFLIVVFWMY